MFDIPAAVEAGSNLISKILDKIAPDADFKEKNRITMALTEMQTEYNVILSQIDVNKEEAKNPHFFVAGARPAALWVCVASLAYSSIGVSFMTWLAACFGLPPLPIVDSTATDAILYGLLGLGGLRTIDKYNGVDTKILGAKK